MDTQEFLAHYGVLGMHWGVRKKEPIPQKRFSSKKAIEDADKVGKKAMGISLAIIASISIGSIIATTLFNKNNEKLVASFNKESLQKSEKVVKDILDLGPSQTHTINVKDVQAAYDRWQSGDKSEFKKLWESGGAFEF